MLIADVNVFIYAHRPESPRHADYRLWLEGALVGRERFGVSLSVLASFVRIVTHHRVYTEPTPPSVALDFCDAVLAAPASAVVRPGADHWGLFRAAVLEGGARGNTVPDAALAALALEHGATWVTSDRGFARFPGLRHVDPLKP